MNTAKQPFFFSFYNETIATHNSFPVLNKEGRPVFEILSMEANGYSREYIMVDKNHKVIYMIRSVLELAAGKQFSFFKKDWRPQVSIMSKEKIVAFTKEGQQGVLKGKPLFLTKKGKFLLKSGPNPYQIQVLGSTGLALDFKVQASSSKRFLTRINSTSSPLLFLALAIGLSLADRDLTSENGSTDY